MNGPPTRKILDNQSQAGNPARLRVSPARLRRWRPDLFGVRRLRWMLIRWYFGDSHPRFSPKRFIEEQLWHGDARAAVVVSVDPLRVAAYSDEIDCVAMLALPARVQAEMNLAPGARLITVNTHRAGWSPHRSDLIPGMYQTGRYTGFYPILADLVTDDRERLDALRQSIPESEWRRAEQLGCEYLAARPQEYRNGLPAKSEFTVGAYREAVVMAIVAVLVVALILALGWYV